ncbi:hypothetical protein [Amycolatopsis sp. H20-H5]|uniref:hypothetical protein n=1 Tax=Amycolatopsis sp. H20-H5 TaxID=3046309 RepID=UPI002DBB7862|nr:hypothetical protein [Amycolatopsis sp. H20-H5]MEC3978309.1 hypothetical protein [Amycolatopsis sp. H20-H5]
MANEPRVSDLPATDLTVPGRRHQAMTGALHGLIAWPVLAIVMMLIGWIGLSGSTHLDGTAVFFLFLLMAPLRYGLYAWPVVVAVAAAVAAFGPARRARRRGWIVAVTAIAVLPVAFVALLSLGS